MSTRFPILFCLLLAVGGCASKRPPPAPPPAVLTPAMWQRIDQELIEASVGAAGSANDYARRSMRVWKEQVQQRTESDFIPLVHRLLDPAMADIESGLVQARQRQRP